jgi:N-acetyl sugar amidotransferase
MKIQFCKKCLYGSDHPLGILFDENGVCTGCLIHNEKDNLDWNYRWELLTKLVSRYKSKNNNNYDCIIPVTGSQDSYFILDIVKNKLGMNPLLVSYNKYFNTPIGIKNLSNLRIKFNCDILIQNVNPVSVKKIINTTLRKFGSIYWPILAGHTVFPVQIAVKHSIPLIIWGAHQGLEQVGMFSHKHNVEMSRRYRKDHDLMGIEADDLLSNFDTLKEEDIWQYRYPDDKVINSVGVRGIYLGNYVRWDPKAQHEEMILKYGYKTRNLNRTFDTYDYVDCFNYMDLHDLLKLYKNGYSKVTDHASREIRFGRISREQGISLVKNYELKSIKYSELFCEWLGVSRNSLNFVMDQHRSSKYWHNENFENWVFKGWSTFNKKKYSKNENLTRSFIENSKLLKNERISYITFGKGYP